MKRLVAVFIGLAFVLASIAAFAGEDASGASAGHEVHKHVVKSKHHRHKKRIAKAKKRHYHAIHASARKSHRAHVVHADPEATSFDAAVATGKLKLQSASALVVNQKTGEALYAKNPEVETPIASITKLMTALVTLDAKLPMDEDITIGTEDVDRIKYTRSRLPLGSTFTREELLHMALIASENRAAAALSRAYPGGRPAFVKAMNEKARQLGMLNTFYVDGTGLSSENRSTAADLAKLVDSAYQYPLIREITSTGSYDIDVPGYRVVRVRHHGRVKRVAKQVERQMAFLNTNALTRNENWDIGLSKTGFINEAGHCLVMQTQIAGEKIIIVLLDSFGKMSRIGDANRIRRWLESGAAANKLAVGTASPGAV